MDTAHLNDAAVEAVLQRLVVPAAAKSLDQAAWPATRVGAKFPLAPRAPAVLPRTAFDKLKKLVRER
jgi:hypothetical protein